MLKTPAFLNSILSQHEASLFIESLAAHEAFKADVMGDIDYLYENLSEEDQNSVSQAFYDALLHEPAFTSPTDLHNYNVKAYLADGWTLSAVFSLESKTSPLLSDFDSLPRNVKEFGGFSFAVLRQLSSEINQDINQGDIQCH